MTTKRPTEPPGSGGFGPFGPSNMKQVYLFIYWNVTIPPEVRERCLSALLQLAKYHTAVEGECPLQVLARIPANPQLLQNHLKRKHAKLKRYSKGSHGNMRSGVLRSLTIADVKVRSGRKRLELPAPWQALVEMASVNKYWIMVLFPFFRWCVEQSLEPDQISQADFEAYKRYLCEFTGRSKDPRSTYRDVVKAWNNARTTIPGWPQIEFRVVDRHDNFVLPQERFGFSDELNRLMAAAQNPDPTFPRRRKRINEVTAKHQTEQVFRIASAFVHETGCDPASIASISQLFEVTAVRAAFRYLAAREYQRQSDRRGKANAQRETSGVSGNDTERVQFVHTQYLYLTAALIITLARWWCNVPQAQLEALKIFSDSIKPEVGLNQMTPGNRAMLRQFNDRELAKSTYFLTDRIFDQYRNRNGFSPSETRRLQRAAMVAFSIATAVRPKNHASTMIGKHLQERNNELHVHYPAHEVKNKVELEFILPQHTAEFLRFYIAKVRPLLFTGDNSHLWPGKNGSAMSSAYVGTLIGDFMEEEVGVRVTGHRFRHLAGYLYLLDDPNGIEVVRLLLGHRSRKTTETYYASLEAREGYKRYDAFLDRRRAEIFDTTDDNEGDGDDN